MYPWISRTLDFWLQFCEKKCSLYMDVYGNCDDHSLLDSSHSKLPDNSFFKFDVSQTRYFFLHLLFFNKTVAVHCQVGCHLLKKF